MLAATHRLIAGIAITLLAASAGAQDTAAASRAENFRLNTASGLSWELAYQGDATAVALLALDPQCPVGREAAKALEEVRAAADPAALSVAAINVRPEATREEVDAMARELGLQYPVLMDQTLTVAKSLGLARSGEGVLISPREDWKVLYRGAADAHGKAALDGTLAGEAVLVPAVSSTGTPISYPRVEVSYTRDIVPILQTKCVSCHVDGGLGPFAMNNYRKVHGWADMIRETVRTKRMPPWHADPAVGAFKNDRSLSAEEETKLLAWVESGAPKDGDEDPLAVVTENLKVEPWQLGEPDHVVQLPQPQQLPAEGVIPYRYIPVEANITEDKWLRALEVRTNNRPVLHHALIFITYPKEYRHIQPDAHSGLNGYFAAYLPGGQIYALPEEMGIFLPKGSVFTFQMHYSVTGKPETEQCEMGLYFHEHTPKKVVKIEAAHENDFLIPPGARDHEVKARYDFDHEAEILGLSPHMHFRGSRFKFAANFPDGELMNLLNVPFYEFDWQPMYMFEQPLKVPAGTRIECVGAFDNSRFNKKNPQPAQMVAFGEQSFEEMFIGYVEFAEDLDPERYQPRPVDPERYVGLGEKITPESIVGMQFRILRNIVVEFFEDGKVESADGTVKGKYEFLDDSRIKVKSLFGEYIFTAIGDELFLQGRPLRRVQ
jgi:hypothetical protein